MEFTRFFALARIGLPALVLVVLWFIVAQAKFFDPLLFPNPLNVFVEFAGIWKTNVGDVLSTLLKVALSVLIGAGIGFLIGFFLYSSDWLYNSISPILDFFRSIPSTALFPLFLLFFGIGDLTNMALAILICALYLSLHVSKGLKSTSEVAITMAKSLKKTEWAILYHIRFKEALPMIFVGFQTAISLTLIVIIITEMFGGTRQGIGKMLIDASYTYNIPKLYAGILLIGFIGYALNLIVVQLERRVVHWHGK